MNIIEQMAVNAGTSWIKNRVTESSTWIGLGASLGAYGASLPTGQWQTIVLAAAGILAAIGAAMKDKASADHAVNNSAIGSLNQVKE